MPLTNNFNIDNNELLKNGFKNDETPLDEYHLNILVDGINHNRESIKNLDTGYATDAELQEEVDRATKSEKDICNHIWGKDSPESGETTVLDSIYAVNTYVQDISKKITGDASICETDNYTNTNAALREDITTLNTNKAPIYSPDFTGTPTAPTASANTDTIQIATTEFVHDAIAADVAETLKEYYTQSVIDEKVTQLTESIDSKASNKNKIITGNENIDSLEEYENSNENLRKRIDDIAAEGTVDEEQVIDIVKDYVESNNGTIVYLSTKEHIARNLELQDVYPIQHTDAILSVVSTNRMEYYTSLPYTTRGVTIYVESDGSLSVNGKATSTINEDVYVGEVKITTPGKYTLYTDNEGIGHEPSTTKKCYPRYTLVDANGNEVQPIAKFSTTPVTIDTDELNCSRILISISLNANTNATFNDANKQTFKIAVQSGEKVEKWTSPNAHSDLEGKTISVYGRNLFNPESIIINEIEISKPIKLNGSEVGYITEPGMYYFKGEMTEDYKIVYSDSGVDRNIQTPLVKGDKFTLIYNVYNVASEPGYAYAKDVQIVYGHTDYSVYEEFNVSYVTSQADGTCDISVLKYPYSFLSIDTDTTEDYSIYLRYDPALSRDWTEKELNKLTKKLEIDYIVEQNIDDNTYYEKWNSGIVKYYTSNTHYLSGGGITNFNGNLNIPTSVCKTVITHNITAENLSTNSKVEVNSREVVTNGNNLNVYYMLYFDSDTVDIKTNHSIIGRWK